MERIIDAQGRSTAPSALGPLTHEVAADRDGIVGAIDCYHIARIARLAGAPNDKGAGVDLLKKTGDAVERGEPLYRIHACLAADYAFATQRAAEHNAYRIDPP